MLISALMRWSSARFCLLSSTISRSPIRRHWSAALSQNFAKAMGAMVGRLVVMNWPGRDAPGFWVRPPSWTADAVVTILAATPAATAKIFARRIVLFAMSLPLHNYLVPDTIATHSCGPFKSIDCILTKSNFATAR
ncbi:hypothetical protein AGR9A_Lc50073 [Agrobacterium salinitolerans str. Hayward 0363]|nr:hypothetical protein AGR9A_Lc50073 [Agrobacterium salinitolerans str. Hayward 0363]